MPARPSGTALGIGLALLALAALAGCKSEKKKAPNVETLTRESTVLPKVVRPKAEAALTQTAQAFDVDGVKRRYVLLAPPPNPAGPKPPLVLVLHGDGGDALSFHRAWPFEHATEGKAFVAYVEGLNKGWNIEPTRDNPDVKYLEAVIKDIEVRNIFDRSRIFAVGYSSGGFMANVLACHRPGLLRGIASNAGGAPYNQLEKWENGFPKCPKQEPVAMLALHGEKDTAVTLDSGRFSAEYWAYVNGCQALEQETTGYDECKAWKGCKPGKPVAFCSVPPLGHWVWDESASATWTFFQKL